MPLHPPGEHRLNTPRRVLLPTSIAFLPYLAGAPPGAYAMRHVQERQSEPLVVASRQAQAVWRHIRKDMRRGEYIRKLPYQDFDLLPIWFCGRTSACRAAEAKVASPERRRATTPTGFTLTQSITGYGLYLNQTLLEMSFTGLPTLCQSSLFSSDWRF